MKPDPTIEERIAALEKENGDLKAASARAALVDSVAKATGLDRAIVGDAERRRRGRAHRAGGGDRRHREGDGSGVCMRCDI